MSSPSPRERLAAVWTRLRSARPSAGALVVLALTLVYVLSYWRYEGWRVGSDGFYSWIFARSMAFDGDLHFANDYRLCGDPWGVGVDEGGGRPANPFYFGPALLWSVPLRLARALVTLPANAPEAVRAGCAGPLVDWGLSIAPLCAGLTLWLGYRAARRYTSDRVAATATALIGVGTPLYHYSALITSYSHVWAALGTAVALWSWVFALEAPEKRWRWALCGLGVGFAALMRIQAGILLLLPGLVQLRALALALRAKSYGDARRHVLDGLVTLGAFALAFAPQLAVYKVLYGAFWVIPQGKSYVLWGHGHPFLTLFAARAALFTWHPLTYAALLGLLVALVRRGRRYEALALLLPCAVDVYVNSCAYWHGGASFGARRHVALTAPLVVFAAVGLAWVWSKVRERPRLLAGLWAGSVLAPWALINAGMSGAMQEGRLSADASTTAGNLYGEGLRTALNEVEKAVGNPFAWPGSLPFALRYRVHPREWTTFTNGGIFEHGYRPVVLRGPDTVELANPAFERALVEGWSKRPDGAYVRAGQRARLLVELGWPYVTQLGLRLRLGEGGPTRVRVSARGALLGTRVLLEETAYPGAFLRVVAPPAGTFDSGVNELLFEVDRDARVDAVRFEDRGRHDTSVR